MVYILSKCCGDRIATGKTVRYLLWIAACHTARNMIISTECGEPLIRCIIDGVMPQLLQKVLRGETL